MSDLIACIIAYNEENLLPQCLESIKNKVDRIVLIEGCIAGFPGDDIHSTDKTLEIAQDYDCEIIQQDASWVNEAQMRSQYLLGKEGDWYVLIDADEKCMTSLPSITDFPTGANAYAINIRMIGAPTQVYRPRLFRHKGMMEYREIHDALFSDGVLISRPEDVVKITSIWFAHYQMIRNDSRRKQKRQYYQAAYAHEPQYRNKWRMFNDG